MKKEVKSQESYKPNEIQSEKDLIGEIHTNWSAKYCP